MVEWSIWPPTNTKVSFLQKYWNIPLLVSGPFITWDIRNVQGGGTAVRATILRETANVKLWAAGKNKGSKNIKSKSIRIQNFQCVKELVHLVAGYMKNNNT